MHSELCHKLCFPATSSHTSVSSELRCVVSSRSIGIEVSDLTMGMVSECHAPPLVCSHSSSNASCVCMVELIGYNHSISFYLDLVLRGYISV